MRLAHNKRLSGALGSCYSFRVDTENIFRCSVICFVFDRGLEQITTQVTRTQGISAKNSSPITDKQRGNSVGLPLAVGYSRPLRLAATS